MKRTPSLPRLSRALSRPSVAGPRRSPVTAPPATAPAPSRRTSIDGFAQRAASATADGDGEVLEVGLGDSSFHSLFPIDRYRSISIHPEPAAGYYGGFEPTRAFAMLPVASERFGVVFCSGVLDRTAEPLGIMAEISRALRSGGHLFLTAPLIVPEPAAPRLAGRSRFGLNYLLDAAGFAIEDLLPVERSSAYAVVARKNERTGRKRRRSDRPGFSPVSAGFPGPVTHEPPSDDEPSSAPTDRTTIELPPVV
ncbi:MAG: class I SAM-dependent methyltransferase [Acidimicrobiia bacterium]|nr:class I SAM-dependent methyltransferase [Acidimicrobiia bacterium]